MTTLRSAASYESAQPNPSLFFDAHLQKYRVQKRTTQMHQFDIFKLRQTIARACSGFESVVSPELIEREVLKSVYDGMPTKDLELLLILASTVFIEKDPAYSYVSAQFLLRRLYKEVMHKSVDPATFVEDYRAAFVQGIIDGMRGGILDERLKIFDLEALAQEMIIARDNSFGFIGLQTLYERYFLKLQGRRIELPQVFWMRIAMGLALEEADPMTYARQFYHQLSTFRFVSSTPTLFHAGTVHPQLSSCYLTTISDDLNHIFKCLGDNANLSKWSGGIGNDWSYLRATGSDIKSIHVTSQGVIPFLKIANDVTAAISRSGSRRGATVAYLETWHYDIDDFLDLRRNTGDERRRAHDMNTANWVPDLFMKRVLADQDWTLFSPDEVPDLHDLYGKKFEERYVYYETQARLGGIRLFRIVPAKQLWRKMLTRLFETGHPWLTFKDACNIRSPQDHVGVIHSSNLCTEITLNTSPEETAVCNLGSINMAWHVIDGAVDWEALAGTVHAAIRMLDNVIDINFYPTKEAKVSNERHRPIGMGLMGFQDALYKLDLSFDDPRSAIFADQLMEFISYHAILASSQLAKERGTYSSYKGSKWNRGIFPIDTLDLLEHERGMPVEIDRTSRMDWTPVREHVRLYGMRNSNTMAIAPTATIANIAGCVPAIEPIYKNIYVKANMSGEFTVVNKYLVEDLKAVGLWNDEMLDLIKYYDGSIQKIEAIPEHIRRKYQEAFEINPVLQAELTAKRAKWIDQSQSHNVFMANVSGQEMHDVFMRGWQLGMKTFYYFRTLGASQIEKSTLDAKKFGFTQKRVYAETVVTSTTEQGSAVETTTTRTCSVDQENCDACQ